MSHTVVASVLLSSNHLFRVEQTSVCTSSNLVDDIWLEINVDGSWNIFSLACSRGFQSISVKY